jgi:uncharacterized membrane protein
MIKDTGDRMHKIFSTLFSRDSWLVWALFTIGLTIRLYRLDGLSLYNDEITTVGRIDHSFLETINLLRHSPFPPLHYMILNLWVSVFGNGEWALRFPSVIFSSLTILVVYQLGRELFNKNVGLIAAALLTFSPFAVSHAQNAKMYALFWLLSTASFLFFFRFLKEPSHKPWMGYVVSSILCCFTMYIGFVLLVTQNIIFLLTAQRVWWKKWFKGQLVILLFCLPWVLWFLSSSHETWGSPQSATFNYLEFFVKSLLAIIGSMQEIWNTEDWAQFSTKLNIWKVNLFIYVFLTVFFASDLVTRFLQKTKGGLVATSHSRLFLWIVISTVTYSLYAVFFIDLNLASRYLGFLQVPILLLVGAQIDRFKGFIKKALIAVLLIIAMTNTYLHFRDSFKYPRQDWRSFTTELSRSLEDNDIVLSILGIPQLKYYYKGDTSRFIQISSAQDCSRELLEKSGLLNENTGAVYILFRERIAPHIFLKGFSIDRKMNYGSVGFLRFKRIE